jgi:hypothetical protein
MMTSFSQPHHNHLAEILQATMVAACIAGVVGFLVATWSPSSPSELRAERPAPASIRA